MSITRAFTTRRVKQSLQAAESADVELIHTTNMLSYNAPDLYPKTASSTNSSHRSDDELSDGPHTAASSPPTSPDISSPKRLSPEPNHLSCYFTPPETPVAPASKPEAPVIPQRAISHTKKSTETLMRQRSISLMSEQSQRTVSTKASFSFSRSSSGSTSTASTSQSSTPPNQRAKITTASISSPVTVASPQQPAQHRKNFSQAQHPFGQELAQVSEIAEEYGIVKELNEIDAEEKELVAKGLFKFNAYDYLSEVQGLYSTFFGDMKPTANVMWI
ncbi:hypothetical protein B0T19DRAFT_396254 [Cercophora scortea]|uniref:Uncharacterized protein n=1 Tax=Cercophora scortea TaxID=314031 RepID=A0AAE0ML13_9PEZI|nr:hypothetical protein B0T19DRAFT_396254 [Cercophora scortea]